MLKLTEGHGQVVDMIVKIYFPASLRSLEIYFHQYRCRRYLRLELSFPITDVITISVAHTYLGYFSAFSKVVRFGDTFLRF
jgi:hypothetical protein